MQNQQLANYGFTWATSSVDKRQGCVVSELDGEWVRRRVGGRVGEGVGEMVDERVGGRVAW